MLSKCDAIVLKMSFKIDDLKDLKGIDHVKQARLRLCQFSNSLFQKLILYFKSSRIADKKSYKNHDDPLHASRVMAPKRQETFNIRTCSPISCNFQV